MPQASLTVPNTFATQSGDVPASELDVNFSQAVGALNNVNQYTSPILDGGFVNAMAGTFPTGITVSYTEYFEIVIVPAYTNTSTAVTLTLGSISAAPVVNSNGSAINVGTLTAGVPTALLYDYAHNQFVLLSAGALSSLFYAQTTAETTAGVMPSVYSDAPRVDLDAARYGFVNDGATVNDAAWTRASAVLVALGGGVLRLVPGSYAFTAAQITLPVNVVIEGSGAVATVLKTGVLCSGTGGRNGVRMLTLQGTAKTGTGLQIGDTNFCGVNRFQDLYIQGFSTGIRCAAAIWTYFENVYATGNTVDLDFNAGSASMYSTTVGFKDCVFALADLQGVKASYVPINNHVIKFDHCTIQENCKTNTALPQFSMSDGTGGVGGLVVVNPYVESSTANINSFDMTACSGWSVTDGYINNSSGSTAFLATAGNCSGGEISGMEVYGCATGVNITSATDVIERKNYWSGSPTMILTGTGCRQLSGNGVASWPAQGVSWTATIKGASTAGSPTYGTVVAAYSKVGNIVNFKVRLTISAIGGMVGGISIEGLPLPAMTLGGAEDILSADCLGVTVSGGNTYFYAVLGSNSTSLQLYQGGSTASSQVVATQLAAATTIQISGSYQTTA